MFSVYVCERISILCTHTQYNSHNPDARDDTTLCIGNTLCNTHLSKPEFKPLLCFHCEQLKWMHKNVLEPFVSHMHHTSGTDAMLRSFSRGNVPSGDKAVAAARNEPTPYTPHDHSQSIFAPKFLVRICAYPMCMGSLSPPHLRAKYKAAPQPKAITRAITVSKLCATIRSVNSATC